MINKNHKRICSAILALFSTIAIAIGIIGLITYPVYVITASIVIFAFASFYNAFMGNI